MKTTHWYNAGLVLGRHLRRWPSTKPTLYRCILFTCNHTVAGGTSFNQYNAEYEYCFTSLSTQSWQYRDRIKPEAWTMPYSYLERHQGLFIVHSTINSTVHSGPLNSLEHCISTSTMTNIRPHRDSSLVLPDYKPQSIRDEPSGPAITALKYLHINHADQRVFSI